MTHELKAESLIALKQRLLDRQAELLEFEETGRLAADTVVLDQTSVGRLSRMDAMQGQAMQKEREIRRSQELQRIEAAFNRINADDYGYCLRCDEMISIQRLEFDPAVLLCINCAK